MIPANFHAALPDAATQPRAVITDRQRRRAKIVNPTLQGNQINITVKIFEPGPGGMVEVAEVTDRISISELDTLPAKANQVLDTHLERIILDYHAKTVIPAIANHTRDF